MVCQISMRGRLRLQKIGSSRPALRWSRAQSAHGTSPPTALPRPAPASACATARWRRCPASAPPVRRQRAAPGTGASAPPCGPAPTGRWRWHRGDRPAPPASMSPRPPRRRRRWAGACAPPPASPARNSRPVISASGKRATRSSVELPGPQPMSTARRTSVSGTAASRSRAGRERSSANFRYWAGDHADMGAMLVLGFRKGEARTAKQFKF